MCEKPQMMFVLFLLYSLAEEWKSSPGCVYKVLDETGILDNYILRCYDTLHTQGRQYLVEDITDFVREKGVAV